MQAFSENHKLLRHNEQKVLPNTDRIERADLSKGTNDHNRHIWHGVLKMLRQVTQGICYEINKLARLMRSCQQNNMIW